MSLRPVTVEVVILMVSPGVGPEEQGLHQHQVRDVELQRSGDRQPGHHQRTLRQEGGAIGRRETCYSHPQLI